MIVYTANNKGIKLTQVNVIQGPFSQTLCRWLTAYREQKGIVCAGVKLTCTFISWIRFHSISLQDDIEEPPQDEKPSFLPDKMPSAEPLRDDLEPLMVPEIAPNPVMSAPPIRSRTQVPNGKIQLSLANGPGGKHRICSYIITVCVLLTKLWFRVVLLFVWNIMQLVAKVTVFMIPSESPCI